MYHRIRITEFRVGLPWATLQYYDGIEQALTYQSTSLLFPILGHMTFTRLNQQQHNLHINTNK